MYNRDRNRRDEGFNRNRPFNRSNGPRPNPIPDGFALYYIAANCPDELDGKVEVHKRYMNERYGCRAAQKSAAHITIVPPFKAEEDIETQIKDFVDTYNMGLVPVEIGLSGFGHFDERVIFIDVVPNEALRSVEQDVNAQFIEQFPSIIFRTKPDFNPHVTIATRDIPEGAFGEAWDHFSGMSFEDSFTCHKLTVMKNVRGRWFAL